MKQRLVGLDLIRGLCALSVMIYHYTHIAGWGDLEGMGTYGVYIFFVLSGFALYYVYSDGEISEKFLRNFYISRCLRILPLFIAVALYRSWGADLNAYTAVRLIIHATPLAGVADTPAFSSLVIGGWSILIEWSFYLLFPFLLLFRNFWSLVALFVLTLLVNYLFVLAAYYPIDGIRPDRAFQAQDTLTFLCYFVGGMLGAHIWTNYLQFNARNFSIPAPLIISLLLMAFIFVLPEIYNFGSRRNFLSGWNSTALILLSCVLVLLASMKEPQGGLRSVAIFLGDISFALYLIHVYVWQAVAGVIGFDNPTLLFVTSGSIAIPLSWLIYRYFEKPIRDIRKTRMGKVRAGIA